MLMMLADAGRAACFGGRLGQLMLMMLADAGRAACFGGRLGQLMLMMFLDRFPIGLKRCSIRFLLH